MITAIIGIIILAIIVFTAIKIVKNILVALLMVGVILVASSLILGSIPNARSIPVIGGILPKIPNSFSEAISAIKKFFYNIDIVDVSRDSYNNLLITVKNTGRMQVSNFTVHVDDEKVNIINEPKDPLKSGKTTVIQTNFNEDFSEIVVQTLQVNVTYSS